MQRKWMMGGAAVVVAGGAWWLFRPKDTGPQWRQAKIDKGNITQKVNATGSVGPLVQVAVGTQVSGVVSALYVDYNSIVKKGQLIAEIDPTLMETQLQDAQASLNRAKDTLDNAKRQYDRSKRLAEAQLISEQDLDTQLIAMQTAAANYDSAKAALARAQANLGYCRITAPVDGVVISRLADVGQTVAASFSTPNLFQIAKDLSQMKVQVSIGESDIDAVMVGQRAFFNVDSLPDKQFSATVSLVRQEPVTTQNVVNYVVEMIVPNEPLNPEGEGQPADGGRRAHGGGPRGPEAGAAAPDPEKAWERMKDRLPEGMTKEAFMKRFQERMKQMKAAQAPAPQAKGAPMSEASLRDLARIPGGSSLLPGPRFKGEYALRPGMTANVTIVTNQKRDVLRVPNAALRFNPAAFIKDDTKKGDGGPKLGQPMMFGPRPGGGQGTGTSGSKGGMVMKKEDRIWVLENGKPKAIVVKAGITDGQFTEVSGDGIQEGLQVLVGVETGQKQAGSPSGAPGGMGHR
jgi:RND family efflux transporter MFP subunit